MDWEVVITVKERQEVAADRSGSSADGSDHVRTLADLKSKFCRLKVEETSSSSSSSKLQCPMVPNRLRSDVENAKDYYEPKLMSLGPYHHGKSELQVGETLKLKLAAAYIQQIGKFVQQSEEQLLDDIYEVIRGKIMELRGCYDEESTKKYKDDEFTVMMLVDGCALLYYIFSVCLGGDHKDYNIRYHDQSRIYQDALLLENQLPYELLLHGLMMKISVKPESANDFWTVMLQEFFSINGESSFQEYKESFLQKMKNYCCRLFLSINQFINGKSKPKSTDNESNPCHHHLLHLFYINFLGHDDSCSKNTPAGDERPSLTHTANENSKGSSSDTKSNRKQPSVGDVKKQVMASFRNVKELMATGISIKPSPTRYLRDISFSSNGFTGCLRLPPITLDKATKAMFFNLIAYEMSSDVPHDFIAYLRFLDSLIDHADDIKELESIGVLQNNLGTHEEMADFFNTVSSNLESNFHAYKDVRVRIRTHLQSHHNSKLRKWITQCLDTYFASPWTVIAWVGAALALFFTAVQTYLSAFPH